MTEYTKPGWLQNAGATHTAEQMRNWLILGIAGTQGSTSLLPIGGVNPMLGSELAVTQTGSPSMAVTVKSGLAIVPGTEGSKQGGYGVGNDADLVLSISAAHATLARIDIVVFRVRDTAYSGGVDSAVLEVVTGTPSGSPTAPATPANSLLLATVAVGAAVTSITNANITDNRNWLTAIGGIIPVATATERNALAGSYNGLSVWRRDLKRLEVNDGTAWREYARPEQALVATSQATTSTSYTDLATVGPAVTIETGTTALVTVSTFTFNGTLGDIDFMGYTISGATTLAASDDRALIFHSQIANGQGRLSVTHLETALTAGTNTFTAKYKVNAGTGTFSNRAIIVTPC
jgi:hypothetical protein